MLRISLGLLGMVLLLTGCMRAHLVAENRDGLIVFHRTNYQSRDISNVTAEEYCQKLQKPTTWISTKVAKQGGYLDTYKCGAVPPAALSHQNNPKAEYSPRRPQASQNRYDREDSEAISGDYFGSRRQSRDDSNW